MIGKKSKKNTNYLFSLNLREAIASVLFGVMIALGKLILRTPINVPGHTGILWMAILATCCLVIRKAGSGTLAGLIAGVLSVFLFPSKQGVLTFFTYFTPGVFMDMLFFLFPFLYEKWYTIALTAAFCHITKLMVNFASGLILHLPLGFLTLGLKVSVIYHFIFGFLGGMIAYAAFAKTALKKMPLILGKQF